MPLDEMTIDGWVDEASSSDSLDFSTVRKRRVTKADTWPRAGLTSGSSSFARSM